MGSKQKRKNNNFSFEPYQPIFSNEQEKLRNEIDNFEYLPDIEQEEQKSALRQVLELFGF